MNSIPKELEKALWIGADTEEVNSANLKEYEINETLELFDNDSKSIYFSARDIENCLELFLEKKEGILNIILLWNNDHYWIDPKDRKNLKSRAELSKWQKYIAKDTIDVSIAVNDQNISIYIDGEAICENEELLPKSLFFEPALNRRMLIGVHDNKSSEGTFLYDKCPSLALRRKFRINKDKKLKSIGILATARGFYECFIDGKRLGEDYYAPGFTDYRLRIDCQEYRINESFFSNNIDGEHELLVFVSHGYYSGFVGYSGAEIYGRENSFIAAMSIEYVDGDHDRIVTDENWDYSRKCPIQIADYLDGEYYDARLLEELKKEESWVKCKLKEDPKKPLPTNGEFTDNQEFSITKQDYPPARIIENFKPVKVVESPKGHVVYDFSQNIAGTVSLTLKAKRGQAFRVRYGEMCYKDGSIYVTNLRSAANTDIYVCSGEEAEKITFSHTSHGFRYIDISLCLNKRLNTMDSEISEGDYDIRACVMDVTAHLISNINRKTGGFSCSDDNLNKLQKNIEYSQKDNFLLVPTDCPQRNERMGWTGDAQVFTPTAVWNYDIKDFMNKYLRDMREATLMYNLNGAVPDTAPLGGDNREGPCGGWADAAVMVPFSLYEEYADKNILIDNYDMMSAWVSYQALPENEDEEGIQYTNRRGDHLSFDDSTLPNLCATAYAAHCADLMSKIAGILNKKEDEKRYLERFEHIKKGFQKRFMLEDGHLVKEASSQTSYALAIDFDLIPLNLTGTREGFLEAMHKKDDHLSVGFLGIDHLLPALSKIGLFDMAATVLMQKSSPGWLYSVVNDATTIWERWNSYEANTGSFGDASMNSFNHYAYGAVGRWIYENILGVKRISAGYDEVEISPKATLGLEYASGYHDTIHGRIEVSWKKTKGSVYEVKIISPKDCKVTVLLEKGFTQV